MDDHKSSINPIYKPGKLNTNAAVLSRIITTVKNRELMTNRSKIRENYKSFLETAQTLIIIYAKLMTN